MPLNVYEPFSALRDLVKWLIGSMAIFRIDPVVFPARSKENCLRVHRNWADALPTPQF